MKIHSVLDARGGRAVKMATVPNLDRFQAQAIWERSEYQTKDGWKTGFFTPQTWIAPFSS